MLTAGGGPPIKLPALSGDHDVDIRPLDPDDICGRISTLRNVLYSAP